MNRILVHAGLAGLILLLTGCSSSSQRYAMHTDAAPQQSINVDSIPDATPRHEPPSRAGNKDYTVRGKHYHVMKSGRGYKKRGIASWYGKKFHGYKTSNGEIYDMFKMTAAHKTLPLPTFLRVTNLKNNRSVIVRVNDRGPFHKDRLIDLSYAAAKKLRIIPHGTAIVEIETVEPGTPSYTKTTANAHHDHAKGKSGFNIYLQAGAYLQKQNAVQMHNRLARIAISQPTRIVYFPEDQIYRVRIGPISNVENADRLAARIARTGIASPHIVVD